MCEVCLIGTLFCVTRRWCLVFYSILRGFQETETHVPTSLLCLFPLPLQELSRQPVCCKPTGGASRCRLLLGFRQEKECATWLVSHDFRCRPFQHRHFSLTKALSQSLLSDPLFSGLYLIPPLVNSHHRGPLGKAWIPIHYMENCISSSSDLFLYTGVFPVSMSACRSQIPWNWS